MLIKILLTSIFFPEIFVVKDAITLSITYVFYAGPSPFDSRQRLCSVKLQRAGGLSYYCSVD